MPSRCPVCGRSFATRAALRQHEQALRHGPTNVRAVNGGPKRANGRRVRQNNQVAKARAGISSFEHCSLDPLGHGGVATGVPDGFTGLSVILENQGLATLTVGDDNDGVIVLLPAAGGECLTHSLAVHSDSTMANYGGFKVNYGIYSADQLSACFESYRTLALGMKISYTGPRYTSTGFVTAVRVPISRALHMRMDPTTYYALLDKDGRVHDVPGAAPPGPSGKMHQDQVIENWSLSPSTLGVMPGAVTFPACDGVYAVGIKQSPVWSFIPAVEEGLLGATKSDGTVVQVTSTSVGVIDPSYSAIVVVAKGLQSGATLLVQWKHCMEALPAITGQGKVFRPMARPSPPPQPGVLDRLARFSSGLVAGVKEAHASGWLDYALKGAQALGGYYTAGAYGVVSMLGSSVSRLALEGP